MQTSVSWARKLRSKHQSHIRRVEKRLNILGDCRTRVASVDHGWKMGYYPETTVSIKSWLRSRSWEGLECGSLYPTTRGPSQGGCTRWQVVNDQCQIMSGGLSRVYPCSFSILFIPFPGFCLSKGDDLAVICGYLLHAVNAQRKWCHFLSVLPGRWQWWQELGRDGLGVVSGSGVGNPQLFCFCLAGQEYPELEFSLDHWPPFFVRVLIADTVRRTMIARSRLPDKLLTDNAHADSFAMSEDWTICASWKAAVSSATRASEGWTAVRDMFTYCDMIIHQVLATLVDHRILLKHTVSASILLDGSTITRKTKQYLTCPLLFDFCLHCTKPCMRKTFLLVLQETGLMTSLGTCLSQVGRDLDILSSTSIRFGGCL